MLVVAALALSGCGGGGGGSSAPATPVLTGQLRLTIPLVVGQNTTFDFPTSTNTVWTPNIPYPADGVFYGSWASVINGPPNVALPTLRVDRFSSPAEEYLSFFISSSSPNGHTVYIWVGGTVIAGNCHLSGSGTRWQFPLCSASGITVDWIAKTITFVGTKLTTVAGTTQSPDAGTLDGTLTFTSL